MSGNALTRTLQIAYPMMIYLALLVCAGIDLVRTGGSGLGPFISTHVDFAVNQ